MCGIDLAPRFLSRNHGVPFWRESPRGKRDEIDQQTTILLQRLSELWQYSSTLPLWQQQQLTEVMAEHYHILQELQITLKELCWQNTELAATRQLLIAERQHYQELFEFALDTYIVTDREAVILAANQSAGKLLNCSPRHLVGKPLVFFLAVESRQEFYRHLSQLQIAQALREWEVQIQPRQRLPFPAMLRVGVVPQAQVVVWQWSLQDLSERKQYEVELETTQHNLARQIEQRNLELSTANQQLKQEIAERQRAIAALSQQTQWQQLMAAIQLRIRQSLDLTVILQTTVAEVRQFLRSDRVLIYRVDAKGNGTVVAESVVAACNSLLGITIKTPLFKERVALYRQGDTRIIHDVQQVGFPTAINQFLQQQQVKASLTLPLLHGNQFWGLLAVHQCSGGRQWQQLEVELLQQLATQVSIAIQHSELCQQLSQLNANLEQQVQERTAQLQQALDLEAMLKRISDDVRDTLNQDQILQTAVWELAVVLNLDGCDAGLYDLERRTSTISYEYAVGRSPTQGQVVSMAEFSGYQQLLQGEYFQFCELVPQLRSAAALLACPIVDDRGVIGDLWLSRPRPAAFSEYEVRLVQQVANQCAIAIRQARLYQAAQTQITELKALNCLKDNFLHTVSHELRTPLANMKMAIQMLGQTLDHNQEFYPDLTQATTQGKSARYLQILHNECDREFQLINDLLDLRKLQAEVQPLVLIQLQLQAWLPPLLAPFRELAKNRQQSLELKISPDLPSLTCDSVSLGRIVNELLNNACKYTPPGEKIVVTAMANSGKMHLSVSNSGVEIPAAEQSRIFEKFYRIRRHDFWQQGGTGLGLTLVKQLASRLGGTIFLSSTTQQTCFKLELPLLKNAEL